MSKTTPPDYATINVPVCPAPDTGTGENLPPELPELPGHATADSAGADLSAALGADQPVTLKPGQRQLIGTGIHIALPSGFEAQIRPRSGLAVRHGVTVLNSPGTIDADYRGEIKVLLINHGDEDFVIRHGMRIAQMVVAPVTRISWQPVAELPASAQGARGDKGFGSTGLD